MAEAIFRFGDIEDSDSECQESLHEDGGDLTSIPSITTKQSVSNTIISEKNDDKTTVNETNTEGEESSQDFNRNRILRELYTVLVSF